MFSPINFAECKNWRGLRDDFRTLNWVEIIDELGLSYNTKKLSHLLANVKI